jgi:hypothetical protein
MKPSKAIKGAVYNSMFAAGGSMVIGEMGNMSGQNFSKMTTPLVNMTGIANTASIGMSVVGSMNPTKKGKKYKMW